MSQANSLERQMLELINQERAAVGVDPLQLELRLNESSEDYSGLMLQQDFFSHTGPGNSSPGDRMEDAGFVFSGSWTWGENIAWQSERGAAGLADDVANLHNSLMNSSGHRANILSPNFEFIGIGIENGDYNGWDAVMVTQNFARTGAFVQIDGSSNPTPPTPTPTPSDPVDMVLTGTNRNDTLTGASGDDTVHGAGGADRINGGGGRDDLWGDSGNDDIRGQDGSDEIDGGDGSDRVYGNAGNDTIYGSAGNDTVYGGGGRDEITGGDGQDSLRAGGGKDVIYGSAGDDDIWGKNGTDTLDGGADNDTLHGGGGGDIFVFSTGDDLVVDFKHTHSSEKIDLSSVNTISSFSDLRANHLSEVSGNAVISDGLGNTMTLLGLDSSNFDSGDFLF